ncbi:flagellar filament capping protein FliD [Halomonas getboli]|uniref:flagellar filament capping protein FliD n=1 Tax=Halomonas getboli TaxID=2935862 RepID=UPI001FFE89C3|nr:flagellar filament capping protein FliD [Halomonas getboli]MCK2185111.1 flagellar filament capping protein FliD [Halomonas getboli]
MASISSLGIGSGLDLNGLLDQLESAEREQLAPLETQKASYKAEISAYGKLESALSSFQDAAAKLNDDSLYRSLSSAVTGDSATATATSEAQAGTYDVSVTNLARSQSIATAGFAEDETFGGEMTLGVGGEAPLSFTIEAGSSLEDVRDTINGQDAGVTASIVNDGSGTPYRLVLSSDETGTEAAIESMSLTDSGVADDRFAFDINNLAPAEGETGYDPAYAGVRQTVAAENAELTVNGIGITSQSNTVEGAIQGVTLELAEEGDSTVKVELNNRALREAVTDFVDAYNEYRSTADDLTSFDQESGAAGELLGDSTMRSVESRMRSALSGGTPGGGMLSDIGISLELDGTLSLDDEALDDVILNDRQALSGFFAGTGDSDGMSDVLDGTLGGLLDDGGTLDNATSGLESNIERLDERYASMEDGIANTVSRYRSQFSQLDSMIANMNQTSTYLTQQFDSLNAQLGQ